MSRIKKENFPWRDRIVIHRLYLAEYVSKYSICEKLTRGRYPRRERERGIGNQKGLLIYLFSLRHFNDYFRLFQISTLQRKKICILADNEKWIVKGFWFWLAYQSSPIFPFCIYVRKSVEWKKERSETRPTLAYWSIIGIINILSFISYCI